MIKAYKIAIVEDEGVYQKNIKDMLNAYQQSNNVVFDVSCFRDIETFLSDYKNYYDIVFMDIELPGMNGMDGARRLREIDSVVLLIFITNMAQFAIQGYEVDALDYILKPVTYKNFSVKLDRALNCIKKHNEKHVVVYGKNGINRMNVSDIIYIEVRGHHLNFHLAGGKEVDVCGALGKLALELKDYGFAQCNNCYLLNLKYIHSINSMSVIMVDGVELQISKRKKKEFLDNFSSYIGKYRGGV